MLLDLPAISPLADVADRCSGAYLRSELFPEAEDVLFAAAVAAAATLFLLFWFAVCLWSVKELESIRSGPRAVSRAWSWKDVVAFECEDGDALESKLEEGSM